MKIYIPSYNRYDHISTQDFIPHKLLKDTFIVIPKSQYKKYKKISKVNIICHKDSLIGISKKRDWILNQCDERYFFMIDDDLVFFLANENKKISPMKKSDFYRAIITMLSWMKKDKVPFVGFGSPAYLHKRTGEWEENYRPCMAYGIDKKVAIKNEIKFSYSIGNFMTHDDMHFAISFLKAGYENRMSNIFITKEDRFKSKKGGILDWRKKEEIMYSLNELIKIHAPYTYIAKGKNYFGNKTLEIKLIIKWKKLRADFKNKTKRNIKHFTKER